MKLAGMGIGDGCMGARAAARCAERAGDAIIRAMDEPTDFPPWADPEASLQLLTLCAQGEGQSIEFKESLPEQGHEIAKSIAAFASSNAGHLLYGVANDGSVVGLKEAQDGEGRDRVMQRVMNVAKDIRPPVHPTVVWAIHERKIVCVVKVEKGFEPFYYSNHRPIVRRGNVSRPAEPGEVEHVFRLRYAGSSAAPQLPSTRQIAERMADVLTLMNAERHEPLAVADLALAMGLPSPADLDAVLAGRTAATFTMLDQFSSRFAVSKEWLVSGRGAPFPSPVEHRRLPEDYLDLIDEENPDTVYAVRSKSSVGEAFIVIESDPMKVWQLPDVWHVSNHVGGTGARQLASLYTLFKHWSKVDKPYMVLGRDVDPALAKSIFDGVIYPGIVAGLSLSHWWDDLTDIEHKWTTRKGSSMAYGKEFVAAQDIVREMLAQRDS